MQGKLEQIVVWALIMDPKSIPVIKEVIGPEDFKIHTFKHAYETLLRMNSSGKEISIPSLYLDMGRPPMSPIIEGMDGAVILDPLHYALILKQRNLEDSITDTAKKREFEETKARLKDLESLGKPASLLTITSMIEAGGRIGGIIKTGFYDLDATVQFRADDLMVIAGRTSIGKSTFGLTILANMARTVPVGMISFEMAPAGIAERLTRMFSTARLSEINSNFFLSNPTAFTLHEVRKAITNMQRQKGIQVVLIDYLQLMQETRNFNSRHIEISFIIRQLKEMAKEFHVGMVVIAQLSRNIDARGEKARPLLGDLKESGDIEHCADIALLLHRDGDEAELIVAKNRYGAKAIIPLVWVSTRTMFGEKERKNTEQWWQD